MKSNRIPGRVMLALVLAGLVVILARQAWLARDRSSSSDREMVAERVARETDRSGRQDGDPKAQLDRESKERTRRQGVADDRPMDRFAGISSELRSNLERYFFATCGIRGKDWNQRRRRFLLSSELNELLSALTNVAVRSMSSDPPDSRCLFEGFVQLGEMGLITEPPAILWDAMRHPDEQVRREALQCLSSLQSPSVCGKIADLMGDPKVGLEAMLALRTCWSGSAVVQIKVLEELTSGSDPTRRKAAAQVLEAWMLPESVPYLQRVLLETPGNLDPDGHTISGPATDLRAACSAALRSCSLSAEARRNRGYSILERNDFLVLESTLMRAHLQRCGLNALEIRSRYSRDHAGLKLPQRLTYLYAILRLGGDLSDPERRLLSEHGVLP